MTLYQTQAIIETQTNTWTPQQIASLSCFSDLASMILGSDGCFRTFRERKAAQVYTGVTHSLLSVAVTSGGALGKQICDPEENALQGEACLINRIVPVWFTLFTGVTLDEAARTEVR
ncbi:hypothetical protein AMECASPLE_001894 [Ameca splendens]|uniref:Uncharacterized protein n=1 Tax=Ameca splendens TaxID=208324 RepID=A0ABV0ZIZ9_9TELE